MIAYKLFKLRKNGTIGPLFINCPQVITFNEWLPAEFHPKKKFKPRKGWHCCSTPQAPHLSIKGRIWCKVEISDYSELVRPDSQGGIWYIAENMKVLSFI